MATVAGAVNPTLGLIAFAFGRAIGPVLVPGVTDLENFAWSEHRVKALNANTVAAMLVEGVWDHARADLEASYTGISTGRLDALRDLIDNPPDVATLFELWRRGLIDAGRFQEGLQHLRIETPYWAPLADLRNVLLSPQELAAARVKGHIDAARQYAESNLQGVTDERAEIMFQTTGNPPGPETLITMLNRGIIGQAEFAQGIKQGNIRPEYVDEYLALRRHLLTPAEVVNLRLRGWHDDAWMNARGAELGFDTATMRDLYLGQGRPISFRQVFIGERRGGVYDGSTAAISAPFLKSLQESNIRPEWYNLAWAQRHTYPSAFVLRALVESGDLTQQEGYDILLFIGWPETLAATVSARWAGGTVNGGGPNVAKAQTQLWSTTHRSYLAGESDAAAVRQRFSLLKMTAADQTAVLALWNSERDLIRKQLTPAQIKKAWQKLSRNYATGAPWTRDDAIAALVARGYSVTEANDFLDIPSGR